MNLTRTCRTTALLVVVLLFGIGAAAQQFRTHAVRQGETLYAIARQYQVTTEALLRHNKEIGDGTSLRPNTILVIPAPEARPVAAQDTAGLIKPVGFRSHKVKRKETLFSITRKYDITERDLKRFNPDLYSSALQKGMVLRIPQYPPGHVPEEAIESQWITYTVQPKETRWSIASKFGISMDSLLALNPDLPQSTSYLAVGEELRLPRPAPSDLKPGQTQRYRSYTVPPKKTLFGLSQEYGITREEIIRLNPEIMERGNLQEGMVLRLPERKPDSIAVNTSNFVFYEVKPGQTEYSLTRKLGVGWSELRELNPDLALGLRAGMVLKIPRQKAVGLPVKNALVLDRFDLRDSIDRRNIPRLMVLFPFRLDRLDLQDEAGTLDRIDKNNALKYSLGLYSGLLVALDSIADMGISAEVRTFDTQLNPERVRNLLLQQDLSSLHAIVGPLDPRSMQEVAARAAEHDLPVISPVPMPEKLPQQNVFYTYTDEARMRQHMLQYMQKTVTDQSLFIISDRENQDAKAAILQAFPATRPIELKEEEKNIFLDMEALQAVLSQDRENWFFVETDNFKIASSMSSILNSVNSDTTRVRMFTTNKGKAFENEVISAVHLSKLRFTFPSVYRDAPDSSFTERYRDRFGGEPDRYAVRGFDLGMDLLLRLAYKPDLFDAADQLGPTRYSGNTFDYIKELEAGYFNTASYILMYDGLRIVEIEGP